MIWGKKFSNLVGKDPRELAQGEWAGLMGIMVIKELSRTLSSTHWHLRGVSPQGRLEGLEGGQGWP